MTNTADPTIRNQRYHPWTATAINIAQVLAIMASWLLLPDDVPPARKIAYWFGAVLVIGVLSWPLLQLPLMHPVKALRLGENLTALPAGYRLPPNGVKRIEFAPDPAEDYVDLTGPVRLCEVTVTVHQHLRYRLIIDLDDAARLNEWATVNGIPIDPTLATLTRAARDE
jgi:hypothetical protein